MTFEIGHWEYNEKNDTDIFKIDNLMEVLIFPIGINIVIDKRAKEWCKLSYPDHPKGCPNFGKKIGCPPNTPDWEDVTKPPYYVVAIRFNLAVWIRIMKTKHKEMSDRQAQCCLYWQGAVRRKLREKCKQQIAFMKSLHPNLKAFYCPEAMGVHVFETCYKNGLRLMKNPERYGVVWKIAILAEEK